MTSKLGSRLVCTFCCALVHVRIQQHSIDDVKHAVLGEHVRLHDPGCGAARRDKFSARVGAEVEVLAGSGDVSGIDEAWAINCCCVDNMVPQYIPELSGIACDLWELLSRSLVGGDEEGETADSVENLGDGGIFDSVVSVIPDTNICAAGETGESRQLAVSFECTLNIAWVFENSTNHVDVQVLVAGLPQNLRVVGLAIDSDIE